MFLKRIYYGILKRACGEMKLAITKTNLDLWANENKGASNIAVVFNEAS